MLCTQKKSSFYFSVIVLFLSLHFNISAWAGDLTVQVTDANGANVENAVIYAEEVGKPHSQIPVSVKIEQKNRQFIPLVTVLQTGSSISFPNLDRVRHHVYSFSPAKTFELKLYSGVPSAPVVFDKPGTAVLGCNIHDRMLAFVHIVDTPFFAKTGINGVAKLADLPSGNYILKAWHYALEKENLVVAQPVKIKTSEQAAIKLKLKPFDMPS